MNIIRTTLLVLALLVSTTLTRAQGVVDDIGGSIGSANVNGISRYFDNAVALSISGSHSSYSRSQAEMVLREFFSKNAPKAFHIEQTGGKGNSKFAIGTLVTANGNYRTYYLLKQKESGFVIQEIRFDK